MITCPHCSGQFDPTPEFELSTGKGKATRIPPNFPGEQQIAWAKAKCLPTNVDVQAEAEKFRDFWLAKAKDDTSKDWSASWRTWISKAVLWAGQAARPVQNPRFNASPAVREPHRARLTPKQLEANAKRLAEFAGGYGKGPQESQPKTPTEALDRVFANERRGQS